MIRLAGPLRVARISRVGPTLETAGPTFLLATLAVIAWTELRATAPIDVVPILFAGAAACVLGLTRTRAPSLAWLATIAGSFAAAAVPVAFASVADPAVVGVSGWLTWAAPAGVAALVALWIAAGYATRPGRRLEPGSVVIAGAIVGWFAISVVVTIAAVLAGERADRAFTWIDVASVPIAWFRPFLAVVVGLGALADLREALGRARAHVAAGAGFWEVGAATIRELVPGQAAAEETRAAAERVRIAGDLHASVVPSLRRAIEEAEGGADPAAVLRHLRAADLELERLMADRWPIVLETFGLVAALEDLAERLEAGGSPPIAIDVERGEGRPPTEIERAAWRFAQVTLDNAVRHAAAAEIRVQIGVDPARVHLVVADDGRGIDPTVAPRPAARGLADATARAASVGGRATIAPGPSGGTTAAFEWPPAAG